MNQYTLMYNIQWTPTTIATGSTSPLLTIQYGTIYFSVYVISSCTAIHLPFGRWLMATPSISAFNPSKELYACMIRR